MQQRWGSFGVIIKDSRIILQQRNDPGTQFHKKWALPGGIIQFGEHPETTLMRRVKEETGIYIEPIKLIPIIKNYIESDKQLLLLHYLALTGNEELNNYDDHNDILKVEWFNFDSIEKISLLRGTKEVIDSAIKKYKSLFNTE